MNGRKSSSRHTLLFYRRTMDRVWIATFILGLVLAASATWSLVGVRTMLYISSDIWLSACAILAFTLSVFAFITRYMAYMQVFDTHINLRTPFLRLNVSYRRVRSAHPALIQQLFPDKELSWAEHHYLAPFYGKTAVVVELSKYPMNPKILRLFLPAQMFSPQSPGLVLMVPDWMKLSTELDSFYGAWLQMQSRPAREESLMKWIER